MINTSTKEIYCNPDSPPAGANFRKILRRLPELKPKQLQEISTPHLYASKPSNNGQLIVVIAAKPGEVLVTFSPLNNRSTFDIASSHYEICSPQMSGSQVVVDFTIIGLNFRRVLNPISISVYNWLVEDVGSEDIIRYGVTDDIYAWKDVFQACRRIWVAGGKAPGFCRAPRHHCWTVGPI